MSKRSSTKSSNLSYRAKECNKETKDVLFACCMTQLIKARPGRSWSRGSFKIYFIFYVPSRAHEKETKREKCETNKIYSTLISREGGGVK